MNPKNNESRSTISRRSALAGIGIVGSIGLAGCINLESFFESSAVTVINNNTSNTASVKILSEKGTVLLDEKFDLKPSASPSASYTGNASKIIVGVNGKTVNKVPFEISKSYCEGEGIVVSINGNGSVSVETSCVDK
jgi:hypothetical protein